MWSSSIVAVKFELVGWKSIGKLILYCSTFCRVVMKKTFLKDKKTNKAKCFYPPQWTPDARTASSWVGAIPVFCLQRAGQVLQLQWHCSTWLADTQGNPLQWDCTWSSLCPTVTKNKALLLRHCLQERWDSNRCVFGLWSRKTGNGSLPTDNLFYNLHKTLRIRWSLGVMRNAWLQAVTLQSLINGPVKGLCPLNSLVHVGRLDQMHPLTLNEKPPQFDEQ